MGTKPLPVNNMRRFTRGAAAAKPKRTFDPIRHRRFDRAGKVALRRAPSQMVPESLDAKTRSVRALAFTETPVPIYDWRSDKMVGEILTVAGMREVESVRLLDAHSRWAAASVLGSATDFREEAETDSSERGGSLTLQFSAASDVEPIWTRVQEGHLRGVSIGGSYARGAYTEIEKGGSFTYAGITYTATDMPLRVVTDWELVEVSVVPIPADSSASIRGQTETNGRNNANKPRHTRDRVGRDQNNAARSATGEDTMIFSVRAKRFLRSLGASAAVLENTEATIEFCRGLEDAQLQQLYSISDRARKIIEGTSVTRAATGSASSSNTATANTQPAATAGEAAQPTREEILRAERERVMEIQAMGANVRPELVTRAINENWTIEQAGHRFFQEISRAAPRGVGRDPQQGSPGIHVQRGVTLEAIQVGVLARHGISPDSHVLRSNEAAAMLGRESVGGRWLCQASRALEDGRQVNDTHARAIEEGHRYSQMSAVDICREVIRMSGRNVPSDREEMIQRAMSLSALNRVFGTAVNARIVQGYITYDDSTRGWVAEQDWPDHRSNQPVIIDKAKGLTKRNSGVAAAHVEWSDKGQAYNVEPYCGQFAIDIIDIRNDTAGFTSIAPEALGEYAAEVRPNLIYGLLLANAALDDTIALFSTSRTNSNDITSNALSVTGLSVAEQRMASFVARAADGSTLPQNYMAGFLIVPRALRQTANQTVRSGLLVSGNTTAAGNLNPHNGEYQVRSDARLDVGFTLNGTALSGSTTRFYIVERSGRRAFSCGYLAGTGRAPIVRSGRYNEPGKYGLWWDVEMPLGAGVLSPDAVVRSAA